MQGKTMFRLSTRQLVTRAGVFLLTVVLAPLSLAQAELLECPAPETAPSASDVALDRSLSSVRGDTAVSMPSTTATRTDRRYDWYIPVATAAKLAANPTTVLVDTRRPEQFAELRVARSLNIPGHHIKTKVFLRGKTLLLLAEGYRYRGLERIAEEWLQRGGKASIVEGGLSAWQREVGTLEGVGNPRSLQTISPDAYYKEHQYKHWQEVFFGTVDATKSSRPMPMDAVLSMNDAPELIRQRLITQAQGASGDLRPLVLIATEDGEGYPHIQAILGNTAPWNVFYLEGGVHAYEQHLARMQAMHARKPHRSNAKPASCAVRG